MGMDTPNLVTTVQESMPIQEVAKESRQVSKQKSSQLTSKEN